MNAEEFEREWVEGKLRVVQTNMLPMNEGDSMKAARLWAEVHLGDRSYANDIIWAFEHPDDAMEILNEG